MLGSFENSLGNTGIDAFNSRPILEARRLNTKQREQNTTQWIDREWSELPYAMMRISAARRPWDGKHVYWRDRSVQLGEVDLHLAKSRAQRAPRYTAAYSHEELRRDFTLYPLLENEQLRWTAPGISDVQLTTDQLAEKLLSKLVTFYTTGLS